MEITLKNKCSYIVIPIRFFSFTVCNLLIDFNLYSCVFFRVIHTFKRATYFEGDNG
jgi:hypothetical protein